MLACCTVNADAAWIRAKLLSLSWEDAESIFLERYRDPFMIHRLQGEFFTLRKTAGESMLAYSAKFERLVHRLHLETSTTLVPQFIASLPDPLATQLQLFALTKPGLSLSEVVCTAISLE